MDSTAGSITESLQARVGQNPEHAQLLSEHRRLEKGRKELESQVSVSGFRVLELGTICLCA